MLSRSCYSTPTSYHSTRFSIRIRLSRSPAARCTGCSGFLFLDTYGKPKVAAHLENYMRSMMEKYRKLYHDSMPTVTPHVLRHTFCANIQETGLDFRCVQAVMGHSEPDVTMLYTHLDDDFIVRSFREAMG